MDENKLIRETERGKRAKRILEDELWIEAWASIETGLLNGWKNSPARDTEGREALWVALQMAEKVRNLFESHMKTGQMAEMQLEKANEQRTRTKRPR